MRVDDHADGTYYVTDDDRAAVDFADRVDALAVNRRFIARLHQAEGRTQRRDERIAAWRKFGEHGQLWQWWHWRERPDREATS